VWIRLLMVVFGGWVTLCGFVFGWLGGVSFKGFCVLLVFFEFFLCLGGLLLCW